MAPRLTRRNLLIGSGLALAAGALPVAALPATSGHETTLEREPIAWHAIVNVFPDDWSADLSMQLRFIPDGERPRFELHSWSEVDRDFTTITTVPLPADTAIHLHTVMWDLAKKAAWWQEGLERIPCPACGNPPFRNPDNPRCAACDGLGGFIVKKAA